MNNIELKNCPFCGGTAKFHKYIETVNHVGNKTSAVVCDKCHASAKLTWDEEEDIKKRFKYTGGYYDMIPGLLDALNNLSINKWNNRV